MGSDFFEDNAYSLLGLSHDATSSEATTAFARAKATRRGSNQELGAALQEISVVSKRLVLDVFTLAPPVPDSIIEQLLQSDAPAVARFGVDPVEALLLVPEVTLSIANERPPALALREDLARAEPILSMEIER